MTGKDVDVSKKKFRKWWTKGELSEDEQIKYYIMGKVLKFVKQHSKD